MKAVRIHRYGGPEVLTFEDAPKPNPGPGDLLVRVYAAGVNPVDWKIREGHLSQKLAHRFPLILGWDVSGVVEAVGPGVTSFKPGDAVFSRPDIARQGAYAESMVARASEVAAKPKTLDHLNSAAVPLAGLTAWQALFGAANLSRGQSVLIHGAAGGVGTLAVQLAKWKGARVIGTASKNLDFLSQLGCDQVIDYSKTPFEHAVRNVDVVLDTIGGETQNRSWDVLKKGGILVSIYQPPSKEMAAARGVNSAFVFIEPNANQLSQIAALIDQGHVKPIVSAVLPLDQARLAHEKSQSGHVGGKIVLQVP